MNFYWKDPSPVWFMAGRKLFSTECSSEDDQMSQAKAWDECPVPAALSQCCDRYSGITSRLRLCGEAAPCSHDDKTQKQLFHFEPHKKHQEENWKAGVTPGMCCWRSVCFPCRAVQHPASQTAPRLPRFWLCSNSTSKCQMTAWGWVEDVLCYCAAPKGSVLLLTLESQWFWASHPNQVRLLLLPCCVCKGHQRGFNTAHTQVRGTREPWRTSTFKHTLKIEKNERVKKWLRKMSV